MLVAFYKDSSLFTKTDTFTKAKTLRVYDSNFAIS